MLRFEDIPDHRNRPNSQPTAEPRTARGPVISLVNAIRKRMRNSTANTHPTPKTTSVIAASVFVNRIGLSAEHGDELVLWPARSVSPAGRGWNQWLSQRLSTDADASRDKSACQESSATPLLRLRVAVSGGTPSPVKRIPHPLDVEDDNRDVAESIANTPRLFPHRGKSNRAHRNSQLFSPRRSSLRGAL